MLRRDFLKLFGGSIAFTGYAASHRSDDFPLAEFSISQLQRGMVEKRWSAVSITNGEGECFEPNQHPRDLTPGQADSRDVGTVGGLSQDKSPRMRFGLS